MMPKFVLNQNGAKLAKATLRKKNNDGGIMLPDSKLYYKATIIKRYVTDINTEIWTNGTEEPSNKSNHLQQRSQDVQWGKGLALSINDVEKSGQSHAKLNNYLVQYTKK